MINHFPRYFSDRAMLLYAAVLLTVVVLFGHYMTWYWYLFGIVEVVGFFYFSNRCSAVWRKLSPRSFERKLFWTSFAIRAAYVLFSFFFYFWIKGDHFDIDAHDVYWYNDMGRMGADMLRNGRFSFEVFSRGYDADDVGYPIWLAIVYLLTGDSVLLARIIKAAISAATVVCMYRLATRNFGEGTGRMAAVFCMLMPNLIYYCGIHLKETEMVFLAVFFVNQADAMIRNREFSLLRILLVVLSGCLLFFFRMVLFAVAFLSVAAALLLSSEKMVGWGKRIGLAAVLALLIGVGFVSRFQSKVNMFDYQNVVEQQEANYAWRATRSGGNSLATYAGAAVFAPMILTMPFPTMVNIPGQQGLNMIHGGNFDKNVISFFTILALFSLFFSGKWKLTVLPAAFMLGYLVVLIFSQFAQSERFHLVALPFILMYAAYGVANLNRREVKWFSWWMVIIFVANVGWQWFKLKGRGMI